MATRPMSRVRGGGAAAEQDDAEQDQGGRDFGDVEGQGLDDQRGADIGAEHHGQGGDQGHRAAGGKTGHHQAGGGAALQDRGDAEAGGEGGQAVAQRGAEPAAQVGAEAALDAGLHHVQAPQQQRDRAGQIEQGPHGRQSPGSGLFLCFGRQVVGGQWLG